MEATETSYCLASLRKIRESLVNCLKHQDLKIGIDYHLSKTTDPFTLNLVINKTGLTSSDYKLILEESNNKISAIKIGPLLLRVNIKSIYGEMTENLKIESSKFKDVLFNFIEKKTSLKPKSKSYHGDFKVNDYLFNPQKSVLIGCEDKYHFDQIIKVLEKDDYYFKRTSIIDGQMHLQVEEKENLDIVKKISFVKNFFEKLEKLCSNDEHRFKVETLITVIMNRMEKADPIKIVLKFAKSDFIDDFINRIPPSWDKEIINLITVEIFLTKEDMDKFVSSNTSPPPILEKFIQPKQLGYLNPSSFLEEMLEDKHVEPQKLVKTKVVVKEIKNKPIQKDFHSKKNKIMQKTEMAEMSYHRKKFVQFFILGIENKLSIPSGKIQIETGRFTSTAESFKISVPKEFQDKVKDYLEEKKVEYSRSNDKDFVIIYSKDYQSKVDNSRGLINLCDKERKNVIRALESKNQNQNISGRGKKMGVFTMNRTATIASTMILVIRIVNKNLTTLKTVFKIVEDYYSNHGKKSLVDVISISTTDVCEVQVKYLPGFYEIEKPIEIKTELKEITEVQVESTDQVEETELDLLISMAAEEETLIQTKIEKLEAEKLENKKDFAISVSGLLVKSFWKTLEDKGIKLVSYKEEEGLFTLSQISPDEIKNSVSQEVLEKLKLIK